MGGWSSGKFVLFGEQVYTFNAAKESGLREGKCHPPPPSEKDLESLQPCGLDAVDLSSD